MSDDLDRLEPLTAVLTRDERWQLMGNRTLEQHHAIIAQYELHAGVPSAVAQQFENARNTWLYAFFSYQLMQVAVMQLHIAGEAALKERARCEGVNLRSKQANTLEKLLNLALTRGWLRDAGFSLVAEPFPLEDEPSEGYAERLATAFRKIRNSLAHGDVLLTPNVGWAFLAVRDLINQLFPPDLPVHAGIEDASSGQVRGLSEKIRTQGAVSQPFQILTAFEFKT